MFLNTIYLGYNYLVLPLTIAGLPPPLILRGILKARVCSLIRQNKSFVRCDQRQKLLTEDTGKIYLKTNCVRFYKSLQIHFCIANFTILTELNSRSR